MYLIARIKEYQKRYETETYNPELHGLLNNIIEYLEMLEFKKTQINNFVDKCLEIWSDTK